MIFRETKVGKNFAQEDAQKLVARSMRYDSEITLESGSKKINGKSLMGVIGMTLRKGDTVTVIAKGDDQEEALDTVIHLLGAV
ncbi:MAG: HPr family phosphocarrier protein [Clostridiales bacterium]|nr:HPr family phosphocarrier protein [Clostridiales bacterium]